MKKKLLSLLTTLALCMSLLPAAVLAGDCEICVDEDNDHWCDECWAQLTDQCVDEDNDHACDICWYVIDSLCVDENNDHWCDECYERLTKLCVSEDDNHHCDICDRYMDWMCRDDDGNHICDFGNCGMEISECDDGDEDYICDSCGAAVYPDPGMLNMESESGECSITVTWSPVLEKVGEDALASYTVYCIAEGYEDFEDEAVRVAYPADESPFTHTFTDLTPEVGYEVGVMMTYTLELEKYDGPYQAISSAHEIPYAVGAAVPDAPEIVDISCGDGTVTVTWMPPQDNGSPVRGYYVQIECGEWLFAGYVGADEINDSGVMSLTADNMDNGKDYVLGVCAFNAVGDGEYTQTEVTIPLIPYVIEVGGVRITGENMADVLGDGTVSFDHEARVLTLNNADISTTVGNYGIHTRVPLTIELVGENKVSCTGYYGLLARDALTICGEGSLHVTGSDFGIYTINYPDATLTVCDSASITAVSGDVASGGSFGIRADGVFTVRDNASVTAIAGKAPGRSCGIYAYTRLNVEDNATVTTTGGYAALDSYGIRTTDVTVSGGVLTTIAGEGELQSTGIYTQGLEILGGEVIALGGAVETGPSIGLQVTKNLTVSGENTVVTATGGVADSSAGIKVGEVMLVEGGTITAAADTGEQSHGMELNVLEVNGGTISAQSGTSEFEDSFCWGIQGNTITINGGSVNALGGAADFRSYGIQSSENMAINGGSVKAASGNARKSFAFWSFLEPTLGTSRAILTPNQGKLDNSGEWYWTVSDLNNTVAQQVEIGQRVNSFDDSSGPVTYKPVVNETENGAVALSVKYPEKGDTVTIETTPDEGYRVGAVTVVDRKGNAVDVTDKGDGTFVFVQPTGKVTVTVKFVPDRNLSEDYADLDRDAWYSEGVEYVLRKGLMTGIDQDTFAPAMTMDRAMLVTVLWNLAGKPEVEGEMPFADVAEDSWYAKAVRWAAAEGIVSGVGEGRFAPADGLTREQLATILYAYEKHNGGGFKGMWMFLLNYPDRADVAEWAYEPLCWMTMHQVMSGKDSGKLDPKGLATRAECAQMLMRYLKG